MSDIREAVRRGHPASNLFPMMSEAELDELAADIRAHGLREPLVLHEGFVLDGRNRWVACLRAGVRPETVYWEGEGGSPTAYVISKNLHRRHLEPGQRAAIAAEALPLFEAEARARQTLGQKVDEGAGRATEHAAAAFDTNRQYVSDAKRLRDEAPEVFERVKAGELTIPEARREAARPAPTGAPAAEPSPETQAYAALARQRAVLELRPDAVAACCADPLRVWHEFAKLELWLGNFNLSLQARAEQQTRHPAAGES